MPINIFRLCASTVLAVGVSFANAFAADPVLERIHAQLMEVRAKRATHPLHVYNYEGDDARDRGATPMLMYVKHELRDWIEAQLRQFRRNDDPASLAKALSAKLDAADLTCTSPKELARCTSDGSDFDGTGYLTGLSIDMQQYSVVYSEKAANHEGEARAVFVVKTDAGILCGTDESAYVYEWSDNHLQRILSDEQLIASDKPYAPQYIDAVQITPLSDKTKTRNILVLGHQGWCSSTWYDTYHRIWRATSDGKPAQLLLSNATWSWLDNEPPIEGSINGKEALVEFRVGSLDGDVHSYETIRHYALDGPQPQRIDPIALGPRAFTEEWLKADWKDGNAWSDPSSLAALQQWHGKLHADFLLGDFTDTTHCSGQIDLWQVGVDFTKEDRSINNKQKFVGPVYFTVRWRPPYHFQMMAVSASPQTSCAAVDKEADADRTLFPVQDWVGWK
jgi:hypothetical protein